MSVSPDGSLLATIDVSGRLCLWEIPSFRLRREWRVEEMVGVEGVGVESVEEMVDVGMEWRCGSGGWEWRVWMWRVWEWRVWEWRVEEMVGMGGGCGSVPYSSARQR